MRAETIYTRLLNDQEMSTHLEKEDSRLAQLNRSDPPNVR
jgi:hypothetical protein